MFTRKIRIFILVILLGSTVFVWDIVFEYSSDDILEVNFLDVGQGDSIFIETPNNKQVLIDGGPDKTVMERLGQTMPFYDRFIDLIILTHPDADHITGLIEVLKYYDVGYILTSGLEKDTLVYKKWKGLIEEKEIPLILAQTGQRIIIQDGIKLEILWPDQSLINSYSKPSNNVSVMGKLIYGDIEFLLTGDAEEKVEKYLVKHEFDLEVDILKLGHHGSKSSTNGNFLEKVNPEIIIISVGENNRFKHPSQEVLERIKNISIYRTDEHGSIKILTDGILFDILTAR